MTWAEDHHDVELMDAAGRVLARRRLPEGVAGMARLHELIGQQLGEDPEDAEVVIGIETDRGPWVAALVTAGYVVYAVNPLQASRYRKRHGVSGAMSDLLTELPDVAAAQEAQLFAPLQVVVWDSDLPGCTRAVDLSDRGAALLVAAGQPLLAYPGRDGEPRLASTGGRARPTPGTRRSSSLTGPGCVVTCIRCRRDEITAKLRLLTTLYRFKSVAWCLTWASCDQLTRPGSTR